MDYSLNATILNPLSKEKPKNAVILCHGYGGDGKDISILASYWRAHLTETIFICPDAPEKCSISSSGFQWFDLTNETQDQILAKSLVAEIKLNKLIDEVKEKNNLSPYFKKVLSFQFTTFLLLHIAYKRVFEGHLIRNHFLKLQLRQAF